MAHNREMAAGGYESWFVSAREPGGRRALWIRHTRHEPASGAPSASYWCTTFDPEPAAVKQILATDDTPGNPDSFEGTATWGGHRSSWSLRVASDEPTLRPLRPSVLYRLPLPRTKVEVPVPDGTISGTVDVDGRRWAIDRWRATVGHNWGTEHAEQWIWLHAAEFTGPVTWVDLVLARVRVGGRLTPWVCSGSVRIGAHIFALGGLGRRARVETLTDSGATLAIPTPGGHLDIEVALKHTAALTYRDPSGSTRHVRHTASATMEILTNGRQSTTTTGAAFEVGSRETDLPTLDLPLED
ncbi:hypothetical protein GCM10009765_67610 [Fodinicola feengrottensis]|uniref:AttH domain-containing protein n=2 Tax=Fodinicola feengrottensis TaxID=435914 RepID=A0ABN2INF1_9ACTN